MASLTCRGLARRPHCIETLPRHEPMPRPCPCPRAMRHVPMRHVPMRHVPCVWGPYPPCGVCRALLRVLSEKASACQTPHQAVAPHAHIYTRLDPTRLARHVRHVCSTLLATAGRAAPTEEEGHTSGEGHTSEEVDPRRRLALVPIVRRRRRRRRRLRFCLEPVWRRRRHKAPHGIGGVVDVARRVRERLAKLVGRRVGRERAQLVELVRLGQLGDVGGAVERALQLFGRESSLPLTARPPRGRLGSDCTRARRHASRRSARRRSADGCALDRCAGGGRVLLLCAAVGCEERGGAGVLRPRGAGAQVADRRVIHRVGAAVALGWLDELWVEAEALGEEHAALVREVEQDAREAHTEDGDTHPDEAFVGTRGGIGEEGRLRDDGPEVAARADDSRDDAERRARDLRDDRVGATLGHLDEERKRGEQQHAEPRRVGLRDVRDGHGHGDGAEKDAEDTLADHRQEEAPDAPRHAAACAEVVGGEAAEGAREKVHHAEGGREDTGDRDGEAVVLVEVERRLVGHRELDAEAHRVEEREQPAVGVGQPHLEHGAAV
mmetsp:Transcript_37875/g.100648  ORF Transcript_37875/g.100648 Transcript_37875/m.100648 type:complete len:551 (-) Transcript_37875:904-2556(-)